MIRPGRNLKLHKFTLLGVVPGLELTVLGFRLPKMRFPKLISAETWTKFYLFLQCCRPEPTVTYFLFLREIFVTLKGTLQALINID